MKKRSKHQIDILKKLYAGNYLVITYDGTIAITPISYSEIIRPTTLNILRDYRLVKKDHRSHLRDWSYYGISARGVKYLETNLLVKKGAKK